MSPMLQNPILQGFYPDPSICRVDDDFYLVNSSFSYFPGVPIFHSKDLMHWRQIGHVLDRPEQLPIDASGISGGIFAPTIRYHAGTFYMITTNIHRGNFIVTAARPEGPWSNPHWIDDAEGIDPSLFWDEDGRCYYTGCGWKKGYNYIWLQEIDLRTFTLVGEKTELWRGALAGAASPEGPHLYKKGDWYYLMIAEGGTEHYHAVTIARSRKPTGPYEGNPGNPIITHRHLGDSYPICNVGHADLVQLKDGRWYMVLLGSRTYGGYHKNLGRETFIAPVDWSGDWPCVSPGTGRIEWQYPSPLPESGEETPVVSPLDFNSLSFNYLGTPSPSPCRIEGNTLYLRCVPETIPPANAHVPAALGFFGIRQQHLSFASAVSVTMPADPRCACGMLVLQHDYSLLRITLCYRDGRPFLQLAKRERRMADFSMQETVLQEKALQKTQFTLGISAREQAYSLSLDGETLTTVDGSFLGSETAGGFVGAYIGLYATGNGADTEAEACFENMTYQGE